MKRVLDLPARGVVAAIRVVRKVRGVDYWASLDGEIINKHGEVLSTPENGRGYPVVDIGGKTQSAHRIVLRTWKGDPPPGYQGAHEDGNKSNNRITNLAWKSALDNAADKRRHGTQPYGSQIPMAKLDEAQVRAIKGMPDQTANEVARLFGVSPKTIRDIRYGRTWRHVAM